jgi:hypothetical protein
MIHVVYQTSGNIAVTDDEALNLPVASDFVGGYS